MTTRARLWACVPTDERATDSDVVAAWEGKSPHYRDRERARLADPGPCSAARRSLGDKWLPCGAPVMPGADLCAQHGGPVKPKKVPVWRQRAAQAWDAGYEAGLEDGRAGGSEHDDNPYRP